jgi:hypothetical protein
MRRFFTVLFVLSIIATAGAFYWRTYLPEGGVPVASERSFNPPSAGSADQDSSAEAPQSLRERIRQPSDRQDLAVTISILSSIISAVAALAQTWLTARAYRQ